MFICINGQLGSGKSEVCRRLRDRCGYEIFSTGIIQRAFAKELGITTLELNTRGKTDHSYDFIIDGRLVKYAEENVGKNIIFDSRMAWHFVPNAYKICLLVNPRVAAERVYGKRESDEETYKSLDEATEDLIKRYRLENERYKTIYNVNTLDYNNYNLIIDTSTITADEVADIVEEYSSRAEAMKSRYIFVSPFNLEINEGNNSEEKILFYREALTNGASLTIRLKQDGKGIIITDDSEKVIAARREGINLIKAFL